MANANNGDLKAPWPGKLGVMIELIVLNRPFSPKISSHNILPAIVAIATPLPEYPEAE
jgi:hypothetical protein